MEIKKGAKISVLMFPWVAHGHISPFLELAKKLATRNFHIYFCSTPVNLESIKKKLSVENMDSIQLIELHLPSSPDLPPHYHTTNGLPPHLMNALKEALHASAPSFSKILETLKPNLVIYDFVQSWAPTLASSYNIPAIQFMTVSASCESYFLHLIKGDDDSKFPFPEISMSEFYKSKLAIEVGTEEHAKEAMRRSCKIQLIRTFREIEGKYLEHLNAKWDKRMVPVGPLVKDPADEDKESNIEISRWLDEKEANSTVFVSFGSEYFLTKEEMEEVASGLENSMVNFIWVIRVLKGEKQSIEELLPNGFFERVGKRGLVVKNWAPQMKILAHSSIGGFVSHCGWSSVLESMKLGVPIIAMPMHIDQPINAKLVSALGVGMEVIRDECGRFTRVEITKVIRKVVVEEDGKDFRSKARDLRNVMIKKGDDDVDETAKELVQICKEYGKIP